MVELGQPKENYALIEKKNAGIYIAQFSGMFTRKIELEMRKT
jgi:hypothetical protein